MGYYHRKVNFVARDYSSQDNYWQVLINTKSQSLSLRMCGCAGVQVCGYDRKDVTNQWHTAPVKPAIIPECPTKSNTKSSWTHPPQRKVFKREVKMVIGRQVLFKNANEPGRKFSTLQITFMTDKSIKNHKPKTKKYQITALLWWVRTVNRTPIREAQACTSKQHQDINRSTP